MAAPEINLSETRNERAVRDMRTAQTQGYWYGMLAINFALTLTSAVSAAVSTSDSGFWERAGIGLLAGIAAFIIGAVAAICLTYVWFWWHAPSRQLDEVRRKVHDLEAKFRENTLFDVICPLTSLGLPINRLDDGTFSASGVGLGIASILVAHRGELTTITRLTAYPEVKFTQVDNKGWETIDAIQVTPIDNPFAGPRAREFYWDIKTPGLWELNGLPFTMSKNQQLQLPKMMVSVTNANQAGIHFEKKETCTLTVKLAIRTDKGAPSLPDQVISLTRSDIRDSLAQFGI